MVLIATRHGFPVLVAANPIENDVLGFTLI
jgi:hypothetical protein